MIANPLSTSSENFRKLMANGNIYRVPPFQRDYSWEEEQWEDLWFDLINLEHEQIHYMGYAVLQPVKEDEFLIIDGQQRFATLSVFVLAALRLLNDWKDKGIDSKNNEERIEELRRGFIGYKNSASLTTTSKLFLNRNNDDFYQSYLLRLRTPPAKSRLKPSQKLLWEAFEYFYKKLTDKYSTNSSGADLAEFVERRVGNNLVFSTILVNDDLRAYQVFETLNARGVKLSSTDLLKNYVFSVVHKTSPADIQEVERQWQSINNLLAEEDLPTFVRHYWNSEHSLARKRSLFRDIKEQIKQRDQAAALLNDLETAAPLYVAFSKPEDSIWSPEQKVWVEALDLFGVSQCYSLLFAARSRWSNSDFTSLLRLCVMLSFRYSVVGGLNPNALEDSYNKAAVGVAKGKLQSIAAVFHELRGVYPHDDKFKSDFAVKSLNTNGNRWKKLTRYILRNIEAKRQGIQPGMDDATVSIEHILPENPPANWESAFSPEEQEIYTHRLGNLALLEPKRNRVADDQIFSEKIPDYQRSQFQLTRDLGQLTEWNPTTLRQRQEKMADYAVQIWRIDY